MSNTNVKEKALHTNERARDDDEEEEEEEIRKICSYICM
jgi:hypothetical protein